MRDPNESMIVRFSKTGEEIPVCLEILQLWISSGKVTENDLINGPILTSGQWKRLGDMRIYFVIKDQPLPEGHPLLEYIDDQQSTGHKAPRTTLKIAIAIRSFLAVLGVGLYLWFKRALMLSSASESNLILFWSSVYFALWVSLPALITIIALRLSEKAGPILVLVHDLVLITSLTIICIPFGDPGPLLLAFLFIIEAIAMIGYMAESRRKHCAMSQEY